VTRQTAWRGKPPKGLDIGFWQSQDNRRKRFNSERRCFFIASTSVDPVKPSRATVSARWHRALRFVGRSRINLGPPLSASEGALWPGGSRDFFLDVQAAPNAVTQHIEIEINDGRREERENLRHQ
jgi:hypothetical protein